MSRCPPRLADERRSPGGTRVRGRVGLVLAGIALTLGLTACQHYQPAPLDPRATAAALDARSLDRPELRQFLATNLPAAPAAWPLPEWDLTALTLAAFHYHPDLGVARARWETASAARRTAGSRPNPVLSATPGYSMNPPAGISPWFPSVSLDVPIETAGKRGYRLATAEHRAEEARLALRTSAWHVRAKVREAALEQDLLARRVALLEERVRQQEAATALLEQRLAAGAASLPEVTPARLARLKAASDLAEARTQRAAADADLAAALGVPRKALDGVRLTPDPVRPLRDAAGQLTSAEARTRALTERSDVLAGLAAYAAAESDLQLQIAKQYPDLHLNPGYQFDQGEHKWSLGLSIELPLLDRNQGPIAEALARRQEAAAAFLALQATVLAEVDQTVATHAAAAAQLDRLVELRRAGEHQVASAQAALDAGAADRLELASARLEASLAELALLDARARLDHALGRLEDALQIPFSGLAAIEPAAPSTAPPERHP